jgi:hypothetical protein
MLPKALFVRESGVGDPAIKARLEMLGFNVVERTASSVVAADAGGADVVFVSESINSETLGSKLRDVATGAVVAEAAVFDEMEMVAASEEGGGWNISQGQRTNQTALNIATPSHPIAAGLTGLVTVTSSPRTFHFGKPTGSATMIATIPGEPTLGAVFAYDKGAAMSGGFVAPQDASVSSFGATSPLPSRMPAGRSSTRPFDTRPRKGQRRCWS